MTPTLPDSVRVVEVGPRDGLQNECVIVPSATKIAFATGLAAAGLTDVEVTSFVRKDRVPQLADAHDVMAGLEQREGVRYWALVPNARGLEGAMAAGVTHIAVFTAASDGFNRANVNAGVDEALARLRPVIADALAAGVTVRGYVSTAFGCPYDGAVDPARAADVSAALTDAGCVEISLGDTIGVAVPRDVDDIVEAHVDVGLSRDRIALHLHDTRGAALANVYAGMLNGIRAFDASAGGLGGCPFAPGATGNLATEDLLYFLEGLEIETDVSLAGVAAASGRMGEALGRVLPSRAWAAFVAKSD